VNLTIVVVTRQNVKIVIVSDALSSYASACADAGVAISNWRSATLCRELNCVATCFLQEFLVHKYLF